MIGRLGGRGVAEVGGWAAKPGEDEPAILLVGDTCVSPSLNTYGLGGIMLSVGQNPYRLNIYVVPLEIDRIDYFNAVPVNSCETL